MAQKPVVDPVTGRITSEDGRWLYDGAQWVPNPELIATPVAPVAPVPNPSNTPWDIPRAVARPAVVFDDEQPIEEALPQRPRSAASSGPRVVTISLGTPKLGWAAAAVLGSCFALLGGLASGAAIGAIFGANVYIDESVFFTDLGAALEKVFWTAVILGSFIGYGAAYASLFAARVKGAPVAAGLMLAATWFAWWGVGSFLDVMSLPHLALSILLVVGSASAWIVRFGRYDS